MSKNSKMVNKAKHAKQFKMTSGPKKTVPVHGKTKAWFQLGKTNNPTKTKKGQTAHTAEATTE